MCSLGKVKPFLGPLSTMDDLRTALAARAYNKELIIASDPRPEVLTQFLSRMYYMGYAHVLLVLRGEPECKQVSRHFADVGCAWYAK